MSNQTDFIRIKNFIDGEWVEETGVEYVPLYNPSTGKVIGEVPLSSEETSLAAVDSSYAAYDGWRRTNIGKRMTYIFDMRQAMIDNLEELAVSMTEKEIMYAEQRVQDCLVIKKT